MVETTAGKPSVLENQQVSELPSLPLTSGIQERFNEILDTRRTEKREKRHAQRVKVLEEAEQRGEVVFTSRIEVVGEDVFVEPH